eukprot:SAG31_NODE_4531_length_3158_cov_4.651193_6_plen_73_part_01
MAVRGRDLVAGYQRPRGGNHSQASDAVGSERDEDPDRTKFKEPVLSKSDFGFRGFMNFKIVIFILKSGKNRNP